MLGTILFVDEATGTAIIRADDGKRYRFAASEWPSASPLTAGVRVDFDAEGDRALAPLPINDTIAEAVVAPAAAGTPPVPVDAPPAPAEVMLSPDALADAPDAEEAPRPDEARGPDEPPVTASPPQPIMPPPVADRTAISAEPGGPEEEQPGRPLSMAGDDVPDYVALSEPDPKAGGMSAIFVVGGVVLLLALAALAYMMWDNAEGAGFAGAASEEAGPSVTLFAQEDLPVRNVASMTNATVLGRIARGDPVTGVEVDGSADSSSRWLRLDGGNRFVPMTGLGPTAPAALPVAPITPPPVAPPIAPGDGFGGPLNGQLDDYRAERDIPADAAPPAIERDVARPRPPAPNRAAPNREPPPARPSRPPDRPFTPSSPQDTRPVGPPGPGNPGRQRDPRETQPVG